MVIDRDQGLHNAISVAGSDIVQNGVSDLSTTYCRKTIESDGVQEIHDAVEQGWGDDPAYETYGLGCYLGSKLSVGDRFVGTLCFVDDEPREPFTHYERAFFDMLVHWFNQLLERRRLTQVDTIFEHAKDGLFVIDVTDVSTFTIRRVNQAYTELTGRSPAEVVNNSPREILGDEQWAKIEPHFRKCIDQRASVEYEVRLSVGENTRWWHTNLVPIIEDGRVIQLVGAMRDITDREQHKQALERSRQQYRILTERFPNGGVFLFDAEFRYQIANGKGLEEAGFTPDDLVGMRVDETFGGEVPDSFVEMCRQTLEGESGIEEIPFEGRTYRVHTTPVRDTEGEIFAGLAMTQDITEQKEREQDLETFREQTDRILDATDSVMWEMDPEHNTVSRRGPVTRVVGASSEEIATPEAFIEEIVHPEDRDRIRQMFSELMAGERTSDEFVFRAESGTDAPKWIWAKGRREELDDDDGYRIAGLARDITERKERERELRETKGRLDLALTGTETGIWEWNLETDDVTWDETLERGMGLEPGTFEGTQEAFERRVHPDDRATVEEAIERAIEHDELYEAEFRMVHEDGDVRWASVRGRLIGDDDGAERMVGVHQDITERKERERRLEALNETSRDLIRAETREAIAEIGVETARDVLGLDANAIHLYDETQSGLAPVAVAEPLYEVIGEPPTFTEGDSIAWRVYESGETLAVDDVQTDPDRYNPETPMRSELYLPLGEHGILIVGSEVADAFDQQDVVLGEILASHITSALTQVERTDQLRDRERELEHRNDRLEAFTNVLSHDLRNPLSVAQGRLELAREDCNSDHLDAVDRAHERIEELITDLLTLAREGETATDIGSVDLAEIAENCWRNVDTKDATLVIDVARTIRADESRLGQLFENLIRNAVEHGSTSNRTESGDSAEHGGPDVTITVGELADGFYVADDGPGIPPDERDDVFEVGYSTHDGGTGLGLSIVTQIAEAHDWALRVTDGSDGGARFEITGVDIVAE